MANRTAESLASIWLAILRLFVLVLRTCRRRRNCDEILFDPGCARAAGTEHSGRVCAWRKPVRRNGQRTRRGGGFLARALAWLYCAVCASCLAVQKQPDYLRRPQQRTLVQLRVPTRRSLLLRWRWQQSGASEEIGVLISIDCVKFLERPWHWRRVEDGLTATDRPRYVRVSPLKGKTSFVTVSRVPGGQKGVLQRSHEDEFPCKMAKVVALAAIAAKFPTTATFQPSAVTAPWKASKLFRSYPQTNRLGTSALSSQSFAMTDGLVSAFPA